LTVQTLNLNFEAQLDKIEKFHSAKFQRLRDDHRDQKYDLLREIQKKEYEAEQAKKKDEAMYQAKLELQQVESNKKLYEVTMKLKK
jgi:hypothetical protein